MANSQFVYVQVRAALQGAILLIDSGDKPDEQTRPRVEFTRKLLAAKSCVVPGSTPEDPEHETRERAPIRTAGREDQVRSTHANSSQLHGKLSREGGRPTRSGTAGGVADPLRVGQYDGWETDVWRFGCHERSRFGNRHREVATHRAIERLFGTWRCR
jgi:hypothetical protein